MRSISWTGGRLSSDAASIWAFLRRASGDDAYERYLEHATCAHAGMPPLSRMEFHRRRTEARWTGVTRCC